MTTMYLSLTYVELIPAALTALVVSRDVLLIYAGLYVRYMGIVPPVSILFYTAHHLRHLTIKFVWPEIFIQQCLFLVYNEKVF